MHQKKLWKNLFERCLGNSRELQNKKGQTLIFPLVGGWWWWMLSFDSGSGSWAPRPNLSHHQPFLPLQVIGQQEDSLFHTISFPKLLLTKINRFLPLQLGDRINKPPFSSYDLLSNTTPALYFTLNSLSTSSWLKFCFSHRVSSMLPRVTDILRTRSLQ